MFFKKLDPNPLLLKLLNLLGEDFAIYSDQVKSGMIKKGRKISQPDFFMGFDIDFSKAKPFFKEGSAAFRVGPVILKGKTGDLKLNIHFIDNLVCGMSGVTEALQNLDINKADVTFAVKRFDAQSEMMELKTILPKEDHGILPFLDPQLIELKGKEYFRIKDIGDGDFVALDRKGILYKVSHDPYEIIQLNLPLSTLVKPK